jgi:hypothetical protein
LKRKQTREPPHLSAWTDEGVLTAAESFIRSFFRRKTAAGHCRIQMIAPSFPDKVISAVALQAEIRLNPVSILI